MFDVRKVIIVGLIAVLFAIFVFSTIEAVYPSPEWDEYCDNERAYPRNVGDSSECPSVDVPQDEQQACEGYIDYRYDSNGCATEYFCNTCQVELSQAQDMHSQIVFYVSAVLSLIAIFVALTLPQALNNKKGKKRNDVHEWVGSGLLLGGALVLIVGTFMGFGSLHAYVKPIVILAELILVIYLAYKKLA